jgi:Do/DeqQ family serine protease
MRRADPGFSSLGSWALLLAATLALAAPAGAAGLPEVAGIPTLAPIIAPITPGVVNIATRGHEPAQRNPLYDDPAFRRFFGTPQKREREREVRATGSGVIVDAAQGYILTNGHVVENADAIEVTTKDNRRFAARLIGRDDDTDIAVIKIEAQNLTALQLGDSDRLQVGDFVIAIGNPFGLGQTVTSGIVSALGRSGLGIEGYEDFIQTDASINPGNSGGALVDLRGRLVGINTAILAPGGGNIGIGFAVPIAMARHAMDEIIRYGSVHRGHVGIRVEDLTPERAAQLRSRRTEGALINDIEPRSPAERAGLRAGDIVVAVDGVPVKSSSQLRNRIGLAPVDSDVALTVERKGTELTITPHIAAAPPRQQQ